MKNKILFLALALAAVIMTGCASGPSYSAYKESIPPLNPEKGRIYFYRTAVLGAAVQPAVRVNGVETGTAKSKGFFFYDCAPGEYVIETSTEVTRKLSLVITKAQERYVRLNISMGFMVGHVYPELVDDAVGKQGRKKGSGFTFYHLRNAPAKDRSLNFGFRLPPPARLRERAPHARGEPWWSRSSAGLWSRRWA